MASLDSKLDFHSNIIEVNDLWFDSVQPVGENKYQVIVSDDTPLGLWGLGPCLAVCGRGKTRESQSVLGLCHVNDSWTIRKIIAIVREAMITAGSLPKTIEFFVIGGERATEDLSGTEKQVQETKEIAQEEKIIEGRFYYVSGDDDASVVLTPKAIYISKQLLFDINDHTIDMGHDIK